MADDDTTITCERCDASLAQGYEYHSRGEAFRVRVCMECKIALEGEARRG